MQKLAFVSAVLLGVCNAQSSFNFMTIGDWGQVNNDQAAVASAMDTWAAKPENKPVNFIISVGDNFYDEGVASVDDPQWKTTFSDVYGTKTSLEPLPWFAVLGNHDYHQNPDAQIEYTQTSQGKWNMDAHYFSRNYSLDGTSIKFIYVDTIWFGPKICPKTTITHPSKKFTEQQTWLEAELKASVSYDWVIVIGHYPLFSDGDGDDTTMQGAMQALFEKYEIDAYICGHDHSMQHLSRHKVQYFVSGNGAIRGHLKHQSSATVHFAIIDPGFSFHKITGKSMLVQYVDGTGAVMYEFTQQARDRSALVSANVLAVSIADSPLSIEARGTGKLEMVRLSLAVLIPAVAAVAMLISRRSPKAAWPSPSEVQPLV